MMITRHHVANLYSQKNRKKEGTKMKFRMVAKKYQIVIASIVAMCFSAIMARNIFDMLNDDGLQMMYGKSLYLDTAIFIIWLAASLWVTNLLVQGKYYPALIWTIVVLSAGAIPSIVVSAVFQAAKIEYSIDNPVIYVCCRIGANGFAGSFVGIMINLSYLGTIMIVSTIYSWFTRKRGYSAF